MGSNTEKKPWTNLQISYKNWSKEIKSDNFFYRKVGRTITKWGVIEKSPILEKLPFLKLTKFMSHFDGSNNIFVDCIYLSVYLVWGPGRPGFSSEEHARSDSHLPGRSWYAPNNCIQVKKQG